MEYRHRNTNRQAHTCIYIWVRAYGYVMDIYDNRNSEGTGGGIEKEKHGIKNEN